MPTSATLTLNAATVDYDRRGHGPPLLLIPGGVGHGGMLGQLASRLVDRYDVVTMSSRVASTQPDTVFGDQHPESHAEDALGVIEELFTEPPVVFGFSSGAITALELLTRRPGHVRLAIVHEPPLVNLLPDAEHHRAALESVRATARVRGLAEAQALMTAAMTAPDGDTETPELRHTGAWLDGYADTEPEPPGPALSELLTRLGELQPVMLEHILVPFTTHEPDLAALDAHSRRLVPVAGIDSRGQLPYRTAAALATRLDLPLTELPGGHLGPVERPTQFADALKALLETP
ncbi:alpha/beta fold hydrolase [Nocardiopsis sp. FIRDI 009]|uniref:alpha/beta fold hydrolase n=1 Tax=Nocardiopsis sp. FIRDI 009 TaxID=714197 RepID=UPI000E25B4FF|nr:alpha/beta hydrolase [Nocardiopsis sp. FIRDI 009]